MSQNISESTAKKCEVVINSQERNKNDEKKSSKKVKNVKKRFSFRKFKSHKNVDHKSVSESNNDQIDVTQLSDNQEPSGKPKITLKNIFRNSSFKKIISNLQHFTNFTVS
jgi:hypothetical protein